MTSIAKTRMRGFTLIEILVALAIFALMAVMLFGGFIAVSNQVDWSRARAARLQQIQTAMLYLARDFSQLQPRPVRSELGDFKEAALSADARSIYLATLTRGGWSNPAGIPRSTLQRVAYQLRTDNSCASIGRCWTGYPVPNHDGQKFSTMSTK